MTRLKIILIALIALLFFSDVQGTHLVGGSVSYQYFGLQNNGNYRYRVRIVMYRDCFASNVEFDDLIDVGIYNNDANRTLARVMRILVSERRRVDPPSGGADCDFKPNVCLEEATYVGMIDLPASTLGYHLVFQRCCRNTQENLIDDMGQTYYAFIPNTSINNSSPAFTEVPAPYICRNDSISIYNTARDVDGDSLVYQFGTPWSGGTEADPVPQLPTTWPQIPNFDNVIYRGGFNVNNPFGFSGVSQIDSRNGLTTILAPAQGRYSIAIDVTEYRNGVMISRVRLDIQLIVVNCPPNATPNISTSNGLTQYTVMEGEEICFDVNANDPDNHNIKLSGFGELFEGVGGSKAIMPQATARGSVNSRFCWTAPCGTSRSTPYPATIEAIDDGCPFKKKAININIRVIPFQGTTIINGPLELCAGSENIEYHSPGQTNSTFSWVVQGGTITSGQGTSRIRVSWGNGPTGSVQVSERSAGGCLASPIRRNVNLLPSPAKPNISGPDTVCADGNGSYFIAPMSNHTYNWNVIRGVVQSGNNTPQIQVNWGAIGQGMVRLSITNNVGCASPEDTFIVQIIESVIDVIDGSPSVCPNSKEIDYFIRNPNSESSYSWTVNQGTQVAGGNSSRIAVNWGEQAVGYVEAVEINKFGCISDPVRMNVIIDYVLQGAMPEGLDTLCEFSANELYSVPRTNGSSYFWDLSGGNFTRYDSTHSVTVDWGPAGNAWLSVFEQAYDSVNNRICISTPLTLNVFLAPYPQNAPIVGQDEICQSNTPEPFSISGFNRSVFNWETDGLDFSEQGDPLITLIPNRPGTFQLKVIETTEFGCQGPENTFTLIIHPRPTTTGIDGDEVICFPRYDGRPYEVQGFPDSRYNWTFDGGAIRSGQGTQQVVLDFNGQQNSIITLQEISDFGCPGDTLRLDVFADNPSVDLEVISVNFEDETKMDIQWSLINAPRYNADFIIQKRANNSNWVNAAVVDLNVTTYIDNGLNTDETDYEYRILGFNLCGDTLYSDIHKQVRIEGQKLEDDPYAVNVYWSNYYGWTDGVNYYELYRKSGREPYVLQNNAGLDTLDSYNDGTKTFMQCYRVKAYSLDGNYESWSNEICFGFDPMLFVPNAFTPNGDYLNDQYSWYHASIKDFNIRIYDRWGELIYQASNPEAYWNALYKGTPVPEGVYIYMISYNGFDGRVVNLKGNITILR